MPEFNIKKTVTLVALLMGVIILCGLGCGMYTHVGADEIVVYQGIGGKMEVWNQPGLKCQCLGTLTRYKKSEQFWFSKHSNEGKETDESIKVRFSDGGHGNVSGSLSYNLPMDPAAMLKLHSTYGSMAGVEHRLVAQVVVKAVYMSGPFMSSKESAGERRPDLINFVTDQIQHGVYRTASHDEKQKDLISGETKTVRIVEPMIKDGSIVREEASPIENFSIGVYNVTINDIAYDETVEKQIKAQQESIAAVQTQMAQARQAEQKLLTAQSEGKANAEKARWEQEVEKTKAVTAAEQERDVAKLALETAELGKKRAIAEGEGEAKKRKLVMEADGALAQKLDAWVSVQKAYADAFSKQPLVPAVVMGGNTSSGGNVNDMVQMMMLKSAKDLALEFRPKADDKK